MQKLIFLSVISIAMISSVQANQIKKDMQYLYYEVIPQMKPVLIYITTTGLFHGIGKILYSYSGVQKYTYNINAIYNSDLNIFTFPQKQLFNKYERLGRAMLTISSILHAPIRSLIGTLVLLNPGSCSCYVMGHPSEESFTKIACSVLKTPRYSLYLATTAIIFESIYRQKKI